MIDKETVNKIAALSKLELTQADEERFSNKLSKILEHFAELANLDTTGVMPLFTPTEMEAHLEEDTVEQEFSVEEILKNAPEKSGNLYKTPPVVG